MHMSSSVEERGAGNGEAAAHFRKNLPFKLSQVLQLLCYTNGHKLGQGRFIFLAYNLEGKTAGKIHSGRNLAFVVKPKNFTAKNNVGYAIASKWDALAIHFENIVAHQTDVYRCSIGPSVGTQNRKVERPVMALPIAHHHHLQTGRRKAKSNKIA